jgi:uncharacterized protein involved in propanediol utilization
VTAIQRSQVSGLASAATDSARLNQPRVPTRGFEELVRMVSEAGASGLSVSHSGTVAAAIFDPARQGLRYRMGELAAALSAIGCSDVCPFEVAG